MAAGGSAHTRAEELRAQAARARAQADALEAEAGAWSAGAEGERRVAASLGRLGHGWYVHHDRLLRPGRGQTNLDHVVVGPSGVYLVDTKNWAGGTSVHENNLWQHTSKSSPKGRELDNVSRFAAEMERGLGLPVVPVIALAGSQASSFGRQRVRGVEIIPSDELVAWLLAQPATSDAVGTELLSRRVAHAYPPASPEVAGDPDTTGWTVADVVGANATPAQPTSRVSAPTIRRVPARRQVRRARRGRGSAVSAVVGLVALFAFSQLAPRIVPLVLGQSVPPSTSGAPGSPSGSTAPKQCLSLTKAVVQRVTGAKVVLEKPTADTDTCTWWLAKPRYASQSADVTIRMGDGASRSFTATGTRGARVDMAPGEASAWLPQGSRLDAWAAGARATRPFIVSLRFSYPTGADKKTALALESAAEKKVIRLAEAMAAAMPR